MYTYYEEEFIEKIMNINRQLQAIIKRWADRQHQTKSEVLDIGLGHGWTRWSRDPPPSLPTPNPCKICVRGSACSTG